MLCQFFPSVVLAIEPLRPTSQQTVSEIAAPARQSSLAGLICEDHVFPASVERSITPAFPTRQRDEPVADFNSSGVARRKLNELSAWKFLPFSGRSAVGGCETVPASVAFVVSTCGGAPLTSPDWLAGSRALFAAEAAESICARACGIGAGEFMADETAEAGGASDAGGAGGGVGAANVFGLLSPANGAASFFSLEKLFARLSLGEASRVASFDFN